MAARVKQPAALFALPLHHLFQLLNAPQRTTSMTPASTADV
ncbi:hypothetical protein ACIBL5_22795 [Streptomyces sp. NPDC050516]